MGGNVNTTEVLKMVREERKRQDAKWGEQNHDPFTWLTILMEEVGEASKDALETKLQGYREEMIQVAAVAVAAVESLDRNKWELRWIEQAPRKV